MITNLLPFLAILLLAWVWLAGARARELATLLARRHCDQRDLQFLDDTVSLARMGLRWTREGLRMRRMFRFDFSLEGVGRRTGYVLLLGTRLELIDDGLPRPSESPGPSGAPVEADQAARPVTDDTGKVIPFRRKDR